MVCCHGILNTNILKWVSVCTNWITLLEKVHKKAVTSQDVVGADIVLWFLNPGGNHWTLMVRPTYSVQGRHAECHNFCHVHTFMLGNWAKEKEDGVLWLLSTRDLSLLHITHHKVSYKFVFAWWQRQMWENKCKNFPHAWTRVTTNLKSHRKIVKRFIAFQPDHKLDREDLNDKYFCPVKWFLK